jgi:nitrous oxide reductase accessory protein NosL
MNMVRIFFLIPALALFSGCVSKVVEEEHPPPLMLARNSDGVTTMQWETEPGYVYTIFYQDNPQSDWKVLPQANRLRGTGKPLNARDATDPRKPPRRYRVLPEKG